MKRLIPYIVFFTLLALAFSCVTKVVPVQLVRYDSLYFAKIARDSIIIRDSVHIVERSDTVFRDRYKYFYHTTERTDTVFVCRRDTVRVPVPVDRELSLWQRTKIQFGGYSMAASVALLSWLILWIVRKTRKE